MKDRFVAKIESRTARVAVVGHGNAWPAHKRFLTEIVLWYWEHYIICCNIQYFWDYKNLAVGERMGDELGLILSCHCARRSAGGPGSRAKLPL